MPAIYGLEHIIYLIIVITLMIIGIILIIKKAKTEKQVTLVIKLIALLLLSVILWNRISIAVGHDDIRLFLPDSFCGTSSLVLSLAVLFFKKNNVILHFVSYIGFVGGSITLFYPDFIGQADSIFYPMTISGLLHHTVMVFLVLAMVITKYLQPSLKKWKYVPIGLSFFMTYGIFLITVIGLDDAMYIMKPVLPGTILNWFVLGLLFIPAQFIFLIIWEKVNKL